MKKVVIFLTPTIIVTGLLMGFSFSPREMKGQPLSETTYYYNNGYANGPNQYIPEGVNGQTDPRDNSITSLSFRDPDHWSTDYNGVTTSSGNFLNQISFEEEFNTDGGGDYAITLTEALDALYSFYDSHSPKYMPSNGDLIYLGNTAIRFYRSSVKH